MSVVTSGTVNVTLYLRRKRLSVLSHLLSSAGEIRSEKAINTVVSPSVK